MKNTTGIKDIEQLLNIFSGLKVMIIGDVMIDAYIFGKVDRISPEAPVPVVHIQNREWRVGGAANVARNVRSLGATAILCAVTGDDENGKKFEELLASDNLTPKGILKSDQHKTTVKTRVIGNNHQLLRVDDESISDLSGETEKRFIGHCVALINSEKPNVIILEDYDKGVLTAGVISQITRTANELQIPVTVDPKKKHFNDYRNVTLFKPNLHELAAGLDISIEKKDTDKIRNTVLQLMKDRNHKMVMVTLSEAGVFIASGNDTQLIPAHLRNISDVSGAGDTVIGVASLCLAAGLDPAQIAALSNLAGGLVCEQVGVVPIDKEILIREVKKDPSLLN